MNVTTMHRVPFYVPRSDGRPRRLTFYDRDLGHEYTILPAERDFPAHDPRSRVRVYREGQRVTIPPNVPNTVEAAYRYARDEAAWVLAVGELISGDADALRGEVSA